MSSRHFYFEQKTKNFNDASGDKGDCDELLLFPDETSAHAAQGIDVDKDEDSEFLQDVPYSSSSVDRSSIGSIPWADDAIKKNKLDWDRVERMLCGEEPLPTEEAELRHEIEDWQRKFPQFLGKKTNLLRQQNSFDSNHTNLEDSRRDIETISNLSLNSLDEDDDEDDDGFLTPTAERLQAKYQTGLQEVPIPLTRRNYFRPNHYNNHLVSLLDRDLRITPVKLRQREHMGQSSAQQKTAQFLTSPTSPIPAAAIVAATNSANTMRSRLRMPPILNVLDSNRRFRGLLNNRSFVQLTHVQQQQQQQHQQQHSNKQYGLQQQHGRPQQFHAKSAALTHASDERRQAAHHGGQGGNRSAWHVPAALAASRFLNNRHAIVLPAINRQRMQDIMTNTTSATDSHNSNSSGQHYSNNSSLNSSSHQYGADGHHIHYTLRTQNYRPSPVMVTGVSNSSTTPSTGRSISAAVHHPRTEYSASAFYIPYSASKFKSFKLP